MSAATVAVVLVALVLAACLVVAARGDCPDVQVRRRHSRRRHRPSTHENSATSNKYLLETMGGGVALLDYDNDGRLDVFFTNGAKLDDPMPEGKLPDKSDPAFWNRLYRQTQQRHVRRCHARRPA